MNKLLYNLKIFNSLTNQVDNLELTSEKIINIYLCGPTVYDHIHIGNLRAVIIFDVLHRLLLSLGLKVNYVHNLTDIDDKIIQKAKKEGKNEIQITNHYIKGYFVNFYNYNILQPTSTPKVSNYIPQIQKFIENLLKKGKAYVQEKDVLFRLKDDYQYGQLSKQKTDKVWEDTRKVSNINKETKQDFVLWKKTNEGINWDSVWGKGRPGWHTECVAFIQELFQGETIDIHGGGRDLLFPHHENERIQYLIRNKQELSKIWLHINHLYWKQEKMSKSLGNVILAKHFYRKYGENVLRYLILSSDWRREIDLSEELIEQAVNYWQKIQNLLKRLKFYLYSQQITFVERPKNNSFYQEKIIENLLNNLNTIKCFYFLDEIINNLNKMIDDQRKDVNLVNDFYFILNILGFKLDLAPYNFSTKLLIKNWEKERVRENYQIADQLRKQLKNLDIL